MNARVGFAIQFLAWSVVTGGAGFAQGGPQTPGETSGDQLAPLRIVDHDPSAGAIEFVYQPGCGTTNTNVYFGPLSQVATAGYSGAVCGIGTTGHFDGFAPGSGSYFFLVVGNAQGIEGPYGHGRAAFVGNACGEVQNVSNPCTPNPAGATCSTSADCGARQRCVNDPALGPRCECLPAFDGLQCADCAPGYTGPECRQCEDGYLTNRFEYATGMHELRTLTNPERHECRPDVTESCAGRTCSGNGTCFEIDREAVCACNPGYTGDVCAPWRIGGTSALFSS